MGGFGLLRVTLLILIYIMLHSTIFFLCDLADKFSKATRYAHDISNLKIPLDTILLRIIYLKENQSFIIVADRIPRAGYDDSVIEQTGPEASR